MSKQLLFLFAIAVLLSACKQIEEQKYTAREWDSITKARHEHEFDSVLDEYVKIHPGVIIPQSNDTKYLLYSKYIDNQYSGLIFEHRSIGWQCGEHSVLYAYNDTCSVLVKLPDMQQPNLDTTEFPEFANDFNTLLNKFNIKYGTTFSFLDMILRQYLYSTRLYSDEIPKLIVSYKNEVIPMTICGEQCRKEYQQNIKSIIEYLKEDGTDTRVYQCGFYFIIIKLNGGTSVQNNRIRSIKILNPHCYCSVCI
jgi:hypothetical protein